MFIENRKEEEAKFHNKIRDEKLTGNKKEYNKLTSNKKFYSITRKSQNYRNNLLIENCQGKKILDFCCGNGDLAIFLAEQDTDVYGIDISTTSIENAKRKATEKRITNIHFLVMDAENMTFENDYFDLIVCNGVLHHLDIKKVYPELARVLKSNGKVICNEPLIYNPIFQLYRNLTPHLRTKWETEHILKKEDIKTAENFFGKIESRFFHLFTLLAVPFRNAKIFNLVLSLMEKIDSIVLRIPGLKWWAWQIIFILSEPKKYGEAENKGN